MPDALRRPVAEGWADPGAVARLHRGFVLALGGYALETAGGVLVTHERIPVPAFNYVDELRLSPERQAAFFERALDHYFQRALRPTFRVALPVPGHVDKALRSFGFQPAADGRHVFVAPTPLGPPPSRGRVTVAEATDEELALVAGFWTEERERAEFLRSLEVAARRPNPGERVVPLVAREDGEPVSAAILYRQGARAEMHAVATRADVRGRGLALELFAQAVGGPALEGAESIVVASRTPRLGARLAPLGFRPAALEVEYALAADAPLQMPDPGPPMPPRWRPPRSATRGPGGPARA